MGDDKALVSSRCWCLSREVVDINTGVVWSTVKWKGELTMIKAGFGKALIITARMVGNYGTELGERGLVTA